MFKGVILLILLMPAVGALACVCPSTFGTLPASEVLSPTFLPRTTVTVTPTLGAPSAPPTAIATSTGSPLPSATPTPTAVPPPPIAEVPKSIVDIGGTQYRTYQFPGDTFRIACQEPCAIDERLIFAKYAGFKVAKEQLVKLMGIDVLAEL